MWPRNGGRCRCYALKGDDVVVDVRGGCRRHAVVVKLEVHCGGGRCVWWLRVMTLCGRTRGVRECLQRKAKEIVCECCSDYCELSSRRKHMMRVLCLGLSQFFLLNATSSIWFHGFADLKKETRGPNQTAAGLLQVGSGSTRTQKNLNIRFGSDWARGWPRPVLTSIKVMFE